MTVDLEAGAAVVSPAEGASFDPRLIPGTVRKAGFSLRDLHVRARGILVRKGGFLTLAMPGALPSARLEGPGLDALGKAAAEGDGVLIEGALRIQDTSSVPVLAVESWVPRGIP